VPAEPFSGGERKCYAPAWRENTLEFSPLCLLCKFFQTCAANVDNLCNAEQNEAVKPCEMLVFPLMSHAWAWSRSAQGEPVPVAEPVPT
jgi:hypothetical protein